MLKLHKWLFIQCLLCLSVICSAEEIIRLSSGEYSPEHSKSLKHNGVLSHIVEEAFALEGITVQWKFLPWARALDNALKAKCNGIATMGYSDKRAAGLYQSDSVSTTITRFYHLKTFTFDWQSMKDLTGIKIGGTVSYDYGEAFNKALQDKTIRMEKATKDIMNFKKLLANRIRLFPMTTGIAEYMLMKNFTHDEIDKITYHPKPLKQNDSYLWLSKKHEDSQRLMILFNKGLKKLKESGKYDEMLAASLKGEYLIKP